MVTEVIYCRHCSSDDLVKNGIAPNNGKQRSTSAAPAGVRAAETPPPKRGYTRARKEEIFLRAYQERSSLRGLQPTFGVSPTTVISWLKKKRASLG